MTKDRLRRAWHDMKSRCLDPGNISYENYGGRGISICERWMVYENFKTDIGERPPGTSLDRIDNDGNYEPGNVRWATRREQNLNKRCTIYLEHGGVRKTLTEWCESSGLSDATLRWRIKIGWTVEEALTTPPLSRDSVRGGPKRGKDFRFKTKVAA